MGQACGEPWGVAGSRERLSVEQRPEAESSWVLCWCEEVSLASQASRQGRRCL